MFYSSEGGPSMDEDLRETGENWPPEKRVALVLSILRGEASVEDAARAHGLAPAQVEEWKERFLAAAEEAITPRATEEPVETPEAPETPAEDLGVWICTFSEQSIAPILFMQAACGDRLPTETSISWNRDVPAPKPFRRSRAISLLHARCRDIPLAGDRMRAFSTRLIETVAFERESALADWRFPVRMAGVVALLEKGQGDDAVGRLFRSIKPSVNRTLAWVGAQELPFVIAAVGYDDKDFAERAFREEHQLPSHVPIVPGPPMSEGLRPGDRPRGRAAGVSRGFMSFLSGGGRNLRFDSTYARQVLAVLWGTMSRR